MDQHKHGNYDVINKVKFVGLSLEHMLVNIFGYNQSSLHLEEGASPGAGTSCQTRRKI